MWLKYSSGRIVAKVNPGYVERPYRTLKTETTTGLVEVDFLRSLGITSTSMQTLHTSTTGNYRATYPDDWKGRIELKLGPKASYSFKSGTGAEEVRVVSDLTDHATGKRMVVALKGVDSERSTGSTMNISTEGGVVKVVFEKMGPPSEKEAILGQAPAYEALGGTSHELPAYADIGNAVTTDYPAEKREKDGWVETTSERGSTDERPAQNRYRY